MRAELESRLDDETLELGSGAAPGRDALAVHMAAKSLIINDDDDFESPELPASPSEKVDA
jgi:hypothetical protein